MASLSNDKGGLRRIVVKCRDGQRRPLRLGRIPDKQAATIFSHVSRLEGCLFDGSAPPPQTSAWLSEISDTLRGRLVALGLAAPKVETIAPTLGGLIDAYKGRPGWRGLKPKTRDNKERSFKFALTHFGAEQPIDAITAAAAADFYAWLRLPKADGGGGQAVATANMIASSIFALLNYAIDAELIHRNPFKALPRAARKGANSHVSGADSQLVLDAMSGTEARLLFGLARWGGLRTPSEPRGLRWCDVDRERERFLVHSPKTERHEGRETRWVPIFPELQPLIQARFDEAVEGEDYVLPRLRHSLYSHPTKLLKTAVRRSGVTQWRRLWHSLRATRQTELAERFPAHVVNAWMGNSAAVADKHYLMMLDSHFEQAARNAAHPTPATPRNDEQESKSEMSVGS
jgi:integrase